MTGGPNSCDECPEYERLFREIDALKSERDDLQALLAQCRSANRALRAELGRDV